MKKIHIDAIASYLRDLDADTMLPNPNFVNGEQTPTIRPWIPVTEILADIDAEATKAEAKRQENRELYSEAHDTVIAHLRGVTQPMTIAEIWEECKDNLPDFTKGKLTYAITRMWASEFTRTEGKINTYSLRS